MKVKIRKYEQLFIALLASIGIINYILQRLNLVPVYTAGFQQYNVLHPNHRLDYAANLFLPRIGVVFLLMIVYFWINLFTIPQIRRTTYKSFYIYPWVLFQMLVLSYLFAIGVNAASYYAHPAYNNYGGFSLFSTLGYNENPLTDLWTGFGSALTFLTIYGIYAGIREYIVYRLENSGSKRNYHILIINQIAASLSIFLLLPALISSFNLIKDDAFYSAYFVFLPSVIIVYISNVYWLFPRFSNMAGISIKLILILLASTLFCSFPFLGFWIRLGIGIGMWPINWLIQIVVVTPITWMLYLQRKDKITELRGAEIALSKSTANLQFLRSQINPHFLFNALNTLYGTALIDGSKRTANGIQMLGDMMRFMLDDNHLDFIPLSNEISYLQNYIALQKLRIQDSDEIEIIEKLTVDNCNHEIIPMLLIPFVENAFKHGINVNKKSWINIALTCNDDRIAFNVRNSIHNTEVNDPERKHSGIGLKNVKERLMIFYEGRHELKYVATENEFIVELIIETKINKS